MRLAHELAHRLSSEQSPVRAQLLREDLSRLRRLCEVAASARDRKACAAAAARLGWTPGDAREHELAHVLRPLVDAVYDYEHGEEGEAIEARIHRAWEALVSRQAGAA